MTTFTLNSGAQTVSRPVSELQRGYKAVLEEVNTGFDVVLTRNSEEIAAVVAIDRYMDAQRKAAMADELARKIEILQARLDLALAGGPSLEEARKLSRETEGLSGADMLAKLRANRNKE